MPARKNSPKLLPPDLYDLTEEDKKRFEEERTLGLVASQSALLNKIAKEVKPEGVALARTQKTADRLVRIARGQQSGNQADRRRRTLVGLAAPQVGESLRIIVVDTEIRSDRTNLGNLECFVDPEIVWRTRETEEGREGCFSAGPVWGLVRRSVAVKIRALSLEGEQIERIFEGFTARIFQHEIDHLDGIRFPARIKSDKKRHWVHTEEVPLYPKNIHRWPRLCTLQRWEALKKGKI